MKKNKILFLIIFLISNLIYCQEPGFDDDVIDVPAAPIDGWVFWVLLVACGYGFKTIIVDRTKKAEEQEE